MSKTIEVTLYEWEELSQTAKDRARMKYTEHLDYEWWDCVYEDAIEEGKERGFNIDTINFSGFYSQGDGARWVGDVEVGKWLSACGVDTIGISAWQQLANEHIISWAVQVKSSPSNYCHENTMYVCDVEDDTGIEDDDVMQLPSIFKGMPVSALFDIIATDDACPYKTTEGLTQAIQDSAKEYAQEIYKRLREDYEYLCSEEAVAEHFKINEVYFTEEGEVA